MFVSVQFKLEFKNNQDKDKLLSLMRLQGSAICFIYNRLKEGKLESLQSEPSSCEAVDGRNSNSHQSVWQVLRSALVLPLLGEFFVRDFSPLKSVMIEGKWQRRASRLVPLEVGGRPNEGVFRTTSAVK